MIVAPLVLGLALPVVGDLLAVPGLDVAVDAVEADVELAAEVPLRVRRLPLEELGERLEPGDPLAALGLPELLEVALVDLRLRVRLRGELRRAADSAAPRGASSRSPCAARRSELMASGRTESP